MESYKHQRLELHGRLVGCIGDSMAILKDEAGVRVVLIDDDAILSAEETKNLDFSALSLMPLDQRARLIPRDGPRVSAVGVYSGASMIEFVSRPDASLVPVAVVHRVDFEACRDSFVGA
ncbi:MAG: hypothetical protein IPL40_08205 [Proteobacteria bacterium]|nr:hypothetical protein [Pseudomonadota bacterium]